MLIFKECYGKEQRKDAATKGNPSQKLGTDRFLCLQQPKAHYSSAVLYPAQPASPRPQRAGEKKGTGGIVPLVKELKLTFVPSEAKTFQALRSVVSPVSTMV